MKKRLFGLIAAIAIAAVCTGCGAFRRASEEPVQQQQAQQEQHPTAPEPEDASGAQGLRLSVDRESGEMSISRPTPAGDEPMGESGTWTIFVYLCGTDLESENGMASEDLEEMRGAADGAVKFVVQTGGTRSWYNRSVDAGRTQRFLIEDGSMRRVWDGERAGMGRSDTLADFLRWGVAEYPAERMGVILWNHGGGSITGVCFDELDDNDSLSLREIDAALLGVLGGMSDKFEFIGFDACLMGTLETANILASYARYLYASQETEPGSGWDYAAIGSYLAAHPDADGERLGRIVCDSFYAACGAVRDDAGATLSVVDLSRLDALLLRFNAFAENLYDASGDAATLAEIVRGIESADSFGGNNRVEGYTNMVDLGGLLSACAGCAAGADGALAALDDAVVYRVNGRTHAGASGLSVYYPLSVQGSQELSIFSDICPSPYYLSFVDRQGHGSVYGETGGYSDDHWFDDSGFWYWAGGYDYDPYTGWYDLFDRYDDYWDYLDGYETSGDSALITFDVEPFLDEDGDFWFMLDEDGLYYAADVYGCVYELSEDGRDLIALGETCGVAADWDRGFFCDDFDGRWLSLPDGQNLSTYIVEAAEDHIVYTSPILLNDRETYLRLRQDYDTGTVTVEGAWDGIDDYGAAARELIRLRSGDVIVPLYYAYGLDGWDDALYYGWEYVVRGTPEILYDLMESGDYLYAFCIDDVYGDYYMSDFEMFYVDGDGDTYYYEE